MLILAFSVKPVLNYINGMHKHYAENEQAQFAKRTKQVEIYLDEDGRITNAANAITKITATIPIDASSRDVAAVNSHKAPAYIEFLQLYGGKRINGKPVALALLDKARQLSGTT